MIIITIHIIKHRLHNFIYKNKMNFFKLNEKQRRSNYIEKHYKIEHIKILQYNKKFHISNFSQMLYNYNYNVINIPKCKCCDNMVKFINFNKGYRIYCSTKCSMSDPFIVEKRNNKSIQTNLEKYGVKNVMKNDNFVMKMIETNKKNHNGVFSSTTDKVKEKIKNTNISRYGVDNYMMTDEFKNKKRITNLKKYGVDNYTKDKKIKEKIKNTIRNKYGVDCYLQTDMCKTIINDKYGGHHMTYKKKHDLLDDFYKKQSLLYYEKLITNDKYTIIDISKKDIRLKHDSCGKEFNIKKQQLYLRNKMNMEICIFCNKLNEPIEEKNIFEFMGNLNIDIIRNTKDIISPYELDIYIPKLKIAFEYNGLHWHNELHKDSHYHLSKTELCEKNGIQLIHIWEDDWLYKQDIVKSMILNKIGKTSERIYGRKTEIKEIHDNNIIRDFLNKNHIQGFVGSKYKIGLYYNNELVSMMTFGKRRIALGKKKTMNNEYELIRFCNKLDTVVIGGASKLFKYFINKYQPIEITTYADRSHSQGNMYEKLGFKLVSVTKPNYYYIIDKNRYYRFNFRKDKLVKEGFDKNKSEHEIMLNRNIYRIYDSGNLKYIFTNNL